MTPAMPPTPPPDWDDLELLEADFADIWAGEAETAWVEAAPFRAHVRQLIADHRLPWRTVAVLTEVPPRALQLLLHGRGRRPAARIHPMVARRLYQLTDEGVRLARTALTPAPPTRLLLAMLLRRGWTVEELAVRTRIPLSELGLIVDGRVDHCSRLTAATVKAAAQALYLRPSPRPVSRPAGLVRAA